MCRDALSDFFSDSLENDAKVFFAFSTHYVSRKQGYVPKPQEMEPFDNLAFLSQILATYIRRKRISPDGVKKKRKILTPNTFRSGNFFF